MAFALSPTFEKCKCVDEPANWMLYPKPASFEHMLEAEIEGLSRRFRIEEQGWP